QSLIGAAAVVGIYEGDFILAAHFGISLICFAAVLLLTLLIFETAHGVETRKIIVKPFLRYNTILVTIYIYFVIYSVDLVIHTDSSRAYTECLHCRPLQILPGNFYPAVQMGHRFLVVILFIWMLIILIHVLRHYSESTILQTRWVIAFTLLVLQVITGMLSLF